MKIGIISINAHTKVLNFASPLHSYAFQQFLLQNNIENVIVDYKPNYYNEFNPKYPLFYYRKHKCKDEKKQKEIEMKWIMLFWARRTRFNKIQRFIDKYYITTDKCYTAKILDEVDLDLDCYICATDVIWKCNKGTGFDKGFFLACNTMKGKGKIAYAASRGPSQYNEKQEKKFLKYIQDFDYISVREKSLGDYIASVSDIPTTHVLDPVLLHEKEFYEPITKRPRKKKKGYVLIYIVMEQIPSLVELAVKFAQEHNLAVIELSDNYKNAGIPKGTLHKVIYNIGIEEWLGYMWDAEYIFTNSFHATCFSILFERQFFVGKRNGDKITSVLEMFGLSDRMVANCFSNEKCICEQIDYMPINKLRKEYKEISKEFILDAIRAVEEKMEGNPIPP